jgi:threonine dehydratase
MSQVKKQRRPGIDEVLTAQRRIFGQVTRTPVVRSGRLDRLLGCKAWFKCENLQQVGAFKFRGASNAVLSLSERGIRDDVATHSSGNHGAALALAAQLDGRRAVVVMPQNSVPEKVAAVRSFGGQVIFCQPNEAAREAGLARLVEQGYIPVPPFDHEDIIAGQGTAALEFLEQQAELDILMTPVGGGGLVSGSAIVTRSLHPDIRVIAAEPAGAADTAEGFAAGKRLTTYQPDTIADGLRAMVGVMTFPIILELVDRVLTVSEAGLVHGMELVREHLDMVIEPSSATVIAAMLEHPRVFSGQRVGAILSGGNIDRTLFPGIRSTADE